MQTLIQNARLVSPDVEIAGASLLLENERIAAVFRTGETPPPAARVIDAAGRIVMPGFYRHPLPRRGRSRRLRRSLDAIRHIARRKLQEGVTTWLPTTLTQPQDKLEEIAAKCAQYMANPEFCRAPGLHVEGPFINRKTPAPRTPSSSARRISRTQTPPRHRPGADRLARPGTSKVRPGSSAQAAEIGIIRSAAHTSATAAQIFAASEAGLKHLTHFCNAMRRSITAKSACVGAGLLDDAS